MGGGVGYTHMHTHDSVRDLQSVCSVIQFMQEAVEGVNFRLVQRHEATRDLEQFGEAARVVGDVYGDAAHYANSTGYFSTLATRVGGWWLGKLFFVASSRHRWV